MQAEIRFRARGSNSPSWNLHYLQRRCTETAPGWKCIFPEATLEARKHKQNEGKKTCLHFDPGQSRKIKKQKNNRALFLFCILQVLLLLTLMWLYSALPDSLLTGLFSGLGLRTWRSGLEIGRPVTLIPSEKTRQHTVSEKHNKVQRHIIKEQLGRTSRRCLPDASQHFTWALLWLIVLIIFLCTRFASSTSC